MYVRSALFLAALVALFSCTNASVTFQTENGTILVTPDNGGGGQGEDDSLSVLGPSEIGISSVVQYLGRGGESPYEYALKAGSDGSIDDQGIMTAPGEEGSAVVIVTDAQGEKVEHEVEILGNGSLGLIGTKNILDVPMPNGTFDWTNAEPRSIQTADDNFIVISDLSRTAPEKRSVHLTRFDKDGNTQSDFGTDGNFLIDVSGDHQLQDVRAAAISGTGNIFFGGYTDIVSTGSSGWLFPLTLWGKLLTSFTSPATFDAGGGQMAVEGLVSQSLGSSEKFLGVGWAVPSTAPRAMITRYEKSGAPDINFGKISNNDDMETQGWVLDNYGLLSPPQSQSSKLNALALNKNQEIYAVGYREPIAGESDCLMVKYNQNGERATGSGVYVFDLVQTENDSCVDIHYHDGSFFVTGWSKINGGGGGNSYLIRKVEADGLLDGNFDITDELDADSVSMTSRGILKTLRLHDGGLIVFEGGYDSGGEALAKLTRYDSSGRIVDGFGTHGQLFLRSPKGGDFRFSARSIVQEKNGALLITGQHYKPQDVVKFTAVMRIWP